MFVQARFAVRRVVSGELVDLIVDWQSDLPAPLHLNYNAGSFAVDPHSIDLAAAPAAPNRVVTPVRVTRLAVGAAYCDVHFVLDTDDAHDAVKVI
jgi:hypothetical protein